jgi:hypothetical protein
MYGYNPCDYDPRLSEEKALRHIEQSQIGESLFDGEFPVEGIEFDLLEMGNAS